MWIFSVSAKIVRAFLFEFWITGKKPIKIEAIKKN